MKPIWDVLSGNAGAAPGPALAQVLIWAVCTVGFVSILFLFFRMLSSAGGSKTSVSTLPVSLTAASAGPMSSIRIGKNLVTRSTMIKLDQTALETARELKGAGRDLDSICRTIEPDYSGWDSLQQMALRQGLEAILKDLDQKKA